MPLGAHHEATMIQLYFDTNIYSFIREKREMAQVADVLAAHPCVLVASSANLFEMFAIEDRSKQAQEVGVLVGLADEFERHPDSWLHAFELRGEIKRLRPKWFRPVVSKRRIRGFLKGHQELWKEAKTGILPPHGAFAAFKRDFEVGVAQSPTAQKDLRQDILSSQTDYALVSSSGRVISVDTTDPETYWRVDCFLVWYEAIEGGNPASRDYADWLAPYSRRGCFREDSYPTFWLTEARGEAVPLNRLTGLVAYYQLLRKISHGNAVDQLHSGHWLRSDLFVTADKAYHQVLTDVATHHYPRRPLPVLADRSAPSFVSQLKTLLAK